MLLAEKLSRALLPFSRFVSFEPICVKRLGRLLFLRVIGGLAVHLAKLRVLEDLSQVHNLFLLVRGILVLLLFESLLSYHVGACSLRTSGVPLGKVQILGAIDEGLACISQDEWTLTS